MASIRQNVDFESALEYCQSVLVNAQLGIILNTDDQATLAGYLADVSEGQSVTVWGSGHFPSTYSPRTSPDNFPPFLHDVGHFRLITRRLQASCVTPIALFRLVTLLLNIVLL